MWTENYSFDLIYSFIIQSKFTHLDLYMDLFCILSANTQLYHVYVYINWISIRIRVGGTFDENNLSHTNRRLPR